MRATWGDRSIAQRYFAAQLYNWMNNEHLQREPHSFSVATLRTIGGGFRGAAQITDAIVVFIGLMIEPRITMQYELTRFDGWGDFLAGAVLVAWTVFALLLFLSRSVGRERGDEEVHPHEQSRDLPWVLVMTRFQIKGPRPVLSLLLLPSTMSASLR